ncbi:MAG: ATP-binding protein [Proteobacteria bacterium]|nr:ATP-binding protein [Pseudomonadota bacterium]
MDVLAERQKVQEGGLQALIEEKVLQVIGNEPMIRVAIDEAQKCPELFDQIKVLYDLYKDKSKIKFVLTGSGFLYLHQLSAETLARRIELFHLREFGLREIMLLDNPAVALPKTSLFDLIAQNAEPNVIQDTIRQLQPFKPLLEESIKKQIIWGGFPEVLILSEVNDRLQYLGGYIQTYLEKDVRGIDTIADLPLYQQLMQILAEQTGSVRDEQKIVDALHCARNTLKKYRGYLIATLLLRELFPFIKSTIKRIVKSPKGYLQNNGLISYLTGIHDLSILEKNRSCRTSC